MNIFFYWDDLNNLPNSYKNNYNVAKALHQNDSVNIITSDEAEFFSKKLKSKTDIKIDLESISIPAAKSDIVRLMALYLEGGWYLDIDLQLKRNLKKLAENKDFVLFNRKDKFDGYWLTNMVMYFKQGHPLLLDVLNFIDYCLTNEILMYDVWSCTGPGALTAFINNYDIDEFNTLTFDKFFTGTGRTFRSIDSQTGSSWKYQQAFGIKKGLKYNKYTMSKEHKNCDRLIGYLKQHDDSRTLECLESHGSVFMQNEIFRCFVSEIRTDNDDLKKVIDLLLKR